MTPSADTSRDVAYALRLAVDAHMGQYDKAGEPYIFHVVRVWRAVASDSRLRKVYEVVALLHDVLEDTSYPRENLLASFGHEAYEAVCAMTKVAGEDYEAYLARVVANPIARYVKRFDVADNYGRLGGIADAATRERLEKKYWRAMEVLRS